MVSAFILTSALAALLTMGSALSVTDFLQLIFPSDSSASMLRVHGWEARLSVPEVPMLMALADFFDASVDALTDQFRAKFFPEGQPFKTPTWDAVKAFFAEEVGMWGDVQVSERVEKDLKDIYDQTFGKGGDRNLSEENLYSSNFQIVADVVRALDRAAGYQWSFGSHSGSPVGLYVTGACAEEFNTVRDNAEIAPLIAKLAGYTK